MLLILFAVEAGRGNGTLGSMPGGLLLSLELRMKDEQLDEERIYVLKQLQTVAVF